MENIIDVNAFDLGDIDNQLLETSDDEVSGLKKAAVLLMTLGPEASSEVIKNLSEKQVQKIGLEIAAISSIASLERRNILKEFVQINKAKDYVIEGGMDYARCLLEGALGKNKASKLLEDISYEATSKPFEFLRKLDENLLMSNLIDENPQTIAVVLSNIQADKSAKILSNLPQSIQSQVAIKIGSISKISPEIIKIIETSLEEKLRSNNKFKMDTSDGVDKLVSILANVDRKTEKFIIDKIERNNKYLAEKIKSSLFMFEDIVTLDNFVIQKILKEVNIKDIAYALKGVDESVTDVIFKNQSSRANEALKEEIENLGPTKLSQIENSQQRIVNIIRRLESEGNVLISRGDDYELII